MGVHRGFARSENIKFTLLSDKKVQIIEAFDLANPRFAKGSSWYGVALPAIFAVNAKGVITHRFSTRDYQDRPSPQDVLNVLRRAGG